MYTYKSLGSATFWMVKVFLWMAVTNGLRDPEKVSLSLKKGCLFNRGNGYKDYMRFHYNWFSIFMSTILTAYVFLFILLRKYLRKPSFLYKLVSVVGQEWSSVRQESCSNQTVSYQITNIFLQNLCERNMTVNNDSKISSLNAFLKSQYVYKLRNNEFKQKEK